MLYAQYEQRTGLFRLVKIHGGGRETVEDETRGYSGRGEHRDKPESQHVKSWGPIPRGEYRLGEPFLHARLGPLAFRLEPRRTNQMFGRGSFLIHGDNARGDASHGCIILNRSMRRALKESGCRYLEVIEGARPSAKRGLEQYEVLSGTNDTVI